MTRVDIHTLSGAYAVDAVDAEERILFEQHLAECAECRDEVDELREAAGLLAESVSVAPPTALRGAVLDSIGSVRPLPPVVRADRQRDRGRRLIVGVVAAVVLAIAGAGAVIVQPWDQGGSSSQLTVADRVLQSADAQRVSLDLPDAGTATVVRSETVGRAVLIAPDLGRAPDGHVYELWLQDESGTMLPAGLMTSASATPVVLDGDAKRSQAVGITVEPEGGSPAPTTDPIAVFDLSKAV